MTELAPLAVIHGRYQIVAPIGRGGMGAVYEAIDQRLGHRVALKQTLVAGDVAERAFEREARLLASLRHPALPAVSDFFAEAEGRFLVMQYIPGPTLAGLAQARGTPFPVDQVLGWADQLLRVLEYLHGRQPPILHRDIKPANIKLTGEGEVVLLDFGLAKGSGQTSGSGPSVYGLTPQYAPLEQFQGGGTVPASDLFAVGGTVYFLLTETPPVDALTRASSLSLGKPDPLRPAGEQNAEVPARVSAWLMRALALHKEDRYRHAAEMRGQLTEIRSGIAATAPPTVPAPAETIPNAPPSPTGPRSVLTDARPRRHRAWLGAGAVTLLALLLATPRSCGRPSSMLPALPERSAEAEITFVDGRGFEFRWAGEDLWLVSREGKRVGIHAGTTEVDVLAGTYNIAANSDSVFEPIEFPVREGKKTIVSRPSGTFEFDWAGDDLWVLTRNGKHVAIHGGATSRVVMPGTYSITPNSDRVFEPVEFTVRAGQKTAVTRPSGTFEFEWAGEDLWVLSRGTVRVATHQGTAGRVVMPGAYRIAPNSDAVFDPIEFTVAAGKRTIVKRPSGSFAFEWNGGGFWLLFRGKEQVGSHQGSASRVVAPGTYRISPLGNAPFEPVEFEVLEGRRTTVRAKGAARLALPTPQ